MALEARALEWATNSPEQEALHKEITKGMIRTRFPPEPNGFLHIGHAKSINMNFEGAFEKLEIPESKRQTILRYDDTNPEAEKGEYIESIRNDLDWLGWKPYKVTTASSYFPQMYEMAVQLISQGDAYVCQQSPEEVEFCRNLIKERMMAGKTAAPVPDPAESPYRNRSVAENLLMFERMRRGEFAAKKACLRLKFDLSSTNPNLWDPVAYRIKYVPHPHVGDEWCIYPTYDFAHCIEDAIEHIDYSICTLEFESRRESYYLLLHKLGLYKPKVYEFARLNITYTVLSKRKVKHLVESKIVRGWDDPRLATISGLRRLGMTPEVLNGFCKDIGVTRVESLVQIERLHAFARNIFDKEAPRALAVLDPLQVTLENYDEEELRDAPDFPQLMNEAGCTNHKIHFGKVLFIDRSDFRLEDDPDFYGLAPNKEVGLKYGYNITCTRVVKADDGSVKELFATVDKERRNKPKGHISWVSSATQKVEIRCYHHLFKTPELVATTDDWTSQINPESEVVYKNATVDASAVEKFASGKHKTLQFERLGYFTRDCDSTKDLLVLNRIVALRDSNNASVTKKIAAGTSRKAEQEKALADKMNKMKIAPEDLFRNTKEYSAFDEATGIPTCNAEGEPLSKSLLKKLKKEWEKQKKLHAKYKESCK